MSKKKYENLLLTVAKNLKKARKRANLTQEAMRDLGFSIRHYQRLESGKSWPNLHTLVRVAEALNINIKDLFK